MLSKIKLSIALLNGEVITRKYGEQETTLYYTDDNGFTAETYSFDEFDNCIIQRYKHLSDTEIYSWYKNKYKRPVVLNKSISLLNL